MSKSITITLPNPVADALESHMLEIGKGLPAGMKPSKSDYVSKSIAKQLASDGVGIAAPVAKLARAAAVATPVETQRENQYEPL